MVHAPAATDTALRMRYRIGRGEMGVLTFQPYKNQLLPLWRFRTPAVARTSATALADRFAAYGAAGDFVGMDMCRKFLQMGMTRARRYANYRGGRKYDPAPAPAAEGEGADGEEGGRGKQREKSAAHPGKREKEEASQIFREAWERCKQEERYLELKAAFVKEQKEWDRARKREKAR